MSCADGTCGTGGWTGPLPGDPDNIISISAVPASGGIDVLWSFPTTNAFAVAYAIVYRGLSPDFAVAMPVGNDTDGSFFDRVNPGTLYYYWVEVISINGTHGAPIGPASAEARASVEKTASELTGIIDESFLAQTLREKIDGITRNNQAIYQEVNDRLAANQALQTALEGVQGDVDQALTHILNETTARSDADGALVTQINSIAAGMNDNAAAIVEERTVRATQTEALASDVTTLFTRTGENAAAIVSEQTTRTDQYTALASDYTAMSGRVGTAEGAIVDIKNLNIAADSALLTRLNSIAANADGAAVAVQDLDTALANGTHALASKVSTVEATLNGDVATGQDGLIVEVDELTGRVNGIWYAKVQVNGLIGGFGINNDGSIVDAGFDVDRFWVGRTGPDAVKPFIIDNGIVYIDKARIRDADIDSLKIAGSAVTVPITVRSDKIVKGTGKNQWQTLAKGYIKLSMPGIVYAHAICSQWYPQGSQEWGMRIKVSGVQGSTIGGAVIQTNPVIAQSIGLAEGVHAVEVEWWGANSNVYIGNTELFIMGAKR